MAPVTIDPAERIDALTERWPFVSAFFAERELDFGDELEWSLERCLQAHRRNHPELDPGWEQAFLAELQAFVAEMMAFVSDAEEPPLRSVTVIGGRDKDGAPEPLERFELRAGDVVCLVGPTGSGKSRLLADIEWVAQGDTPTGRRVLLDGERPDRKWRFSTEHKLVAQLSQNMNFVMDLSVRAFLELHAQSRGGVGGDIVERIHAKANELAGEPFELDQPITSLSGGQSRALMIADTALLSRSPIVLIDEIENAGIDRKKALELLISEDKMVLMATHDPLLALYGDRRVVLRNGAMSAEITPTEAELANIDELRAIDERIMRLRDRLRQGELLETL
jgi:ABC-type lipoprotein export system ATPase subunit